MSEEKELKLACLHQAGGDLDHAQRLFDWVSGSVRATPDSEAAEVSAPKQDKPQQSFNYRHPSKYGTDVPRRCYLEELTPEERAIRDLVDTVERLGAHPLLTATVIQLMKAGEDLADWVDIGLRDKAIAALSPGNDLGLLDDGQQETSPVQSAIDQDKAWQSDGLGQLTPHPWSLISAYRDGYEGRKHIAPHHPAYMREYNIGAAAKASNADIPPAQEAPAIPEGEEGRMIEFPAAIPDPILAERHRQITIEGWSPEHDDEHGAQILLQAAQAYRLHGREMNVRSGDETYVFDGLTGWPWDAKWWKPKSRRRNLEKAGALALAARDCKRRAEGEGAYVGHINYRLNQIIEAYNALPAEAGAPPSELESSPEPGDDRVEPLHDRPKLTNEEFESLEKIAEYFVDQPTALISEENEAQSASETPVSSTVFLDQAEAAINDKSEDEPVTHPDAAFWAKALPAEAEAKAESKRINIFGIEFGGGAKKTLVGEGV